MNDLVARLGLAQPVVSKHLRVLREVGLGQVRGAGRKRRTGSTAARSSPLPVGEELRADLGDRFERLDAVLAELMESEGTDDGGN